MFKIYSIIKFIYFYVKLIYLFLLNYFSNN